MNYKKYEEFRNNAPGFTKEMDMIFTEVSEGYAKAEMEVQQKHMNPIGSVHGGVIFALADTTGGVAATAKNDSFVTTVSGNINYLNPAINVKKLIATTKELKVGKNILVYDVTIADETEKVIAEARMTYFNLNKEIKL